MDSHDGYIIRFSYLLHTCKNTKLGWVTLEGSKLSLHYFYNAFSSYPEHKYIAKDTFSSAPNPIIRILNPILGQNVWKLTMLFQRHNVTEIQSWLSTNGLPVHRDTLEPLVQASHLLQSKKDESNLDTLCGEMTSKLKPKQVCFYSREVWWLLI